jgi:hypothetical protein
MTAPAGWYPDPGGTPQLRYYDGTNWTDRYVAAPKSGTVEAFSRAMIEKFLASKDLSFRLETNGYLVQTEYTESAGCDVTWAFAVEGTDKEILALVAILERRLPEDRWNEVITACNQWHLDNRWPMVSLQTKADSGNVGKLIAEFEIYLANGIHQEALDAFITTFIAAADKFSK